MDRQLILQRNTPVRLSLRSPQLILGAMQEDYERRRACRKSTGAKVLDITVMQCLC